MVKLTRKSNRRNIVAGKRTFFAGYKTFMERRFFEAKTKQLHAPDGAWFIVVRPTFPTSHSGGADYVLAKC